MRFQKYFFTNQNGVADAFINMWGKVASFFVGEANVLGYELINEPSGGNLYTNPFDYLQVSVDNNKYLLPLYQKIANKIR